LGYELGSLIAGIKHGASLAVGTHSLVKHHSGKAKTKMLKFGKSSPGQGLYILDDPDKEPLLEQYAGHLAALNELVIASNSKLEGNIFYFHHTHPTTSPEPKRRHKRRNFISFVMSGKSLLEIGFNAGHSAMLSLTANQRLTYRGIDIACHNYTIPCYEYLSGAFGDRIDLTVGDSRDELPRVADLEAYDLIHLDGGHGLDVAEVDLCNIINRAAHGTRLLFDDMNMKSLRLLCEHYILRGLISEITPRSWLGNDQAVFLISR